MKKIDFAEIVGEIMFLFGFGYIFLSASFGVLILAYAECSSEDIIKYSFLCGLIIWVCKSFTLFIIGDGFKRYLKREYRIAWIPIDKELPKEPNKPFSKFKSLNYRRYVCLVKNGTNDAYCEILLTYLGDGKWMNKGEDISSKVHAWKKL